VLSDKAIISDEFFIRRFSNEGTVDGTYRPLRNIMGLWVIQNCKRQWDREEKLSWKELDVLVDKAPAFRSFIDVNAHQFFDADNMTQKIQKFCEDTSQPVPQTKGEIARTVYESLAMSYREAFEGFEQLKGGKIDVLHIVGGGSRNILLNQITADAINRPVVAGPDEATAIGNLMVQVKAAGEVSNSDEMRQVIRDSFDVEVYEPRNIEEWEEQYQRFLHLKTMNG
jgi:sugar (pentulose or hexulose) kinase